VATTRESVLGLALFRTGKTDRYKKEKEVREANISALRVEEIHKNNILFKI